MFWEISLLMEKLRKGIKETPRLLADVRNPSHFSVVKSRKTVERIESKTNVFQCR